MIKYSENGFWIKKDDETYTIGLSDKGQDDLGSVTFVSINDVESIDASDSLISVEAEKAVTELESPLSGKVIALNKNLEDQPELLNESSEADNWIAVLSDVDENDFYVLQDESGI